MLFKAGRNWAVEFFVRRGWLTRRRKLLRRSLQPGWLAPRAAECFEARVLLSTITVTSLADTLTVGNGVTLRDAIQSANTDTSVDGSVAGESGVQNVIVFQQEL